MLFIIQIFFQSKCSTTEDKMGNWFDGKISTADDVVSKDKLIDEATTVRGIATVIVVTSVGSMIYFAYKSYFSDWNYKISREVLKKLYIPTKMPEKYFSREQLEKEIKDLLGKSYLIIFYGPKLSGKSTCVKHVLRERPGVISISYNNDSSLFASIGRFLGIPQDQWEESMIEEIFVKSKKEFACNPIINCDVNGEYESTMTSWIYDARRLTEGGKGVCDIIFQFSKQDAAMCGMVELYWTKWIRFGDLNVDGAISYLKANGFDDEKAKQTLKIFKITRIGVLDVIISEGKHTMMNNVVDKFETAWNNFDFLPDFLNSTFKVSNLEEKLHIIDDKELYQHFLFKKSILGVYLMKKIVFFDNELVTDLVTNFKSGDKDTKKYFEGI
jgi:hypothetical protein